MHRNCIAHRDLKPANIFINNGSLVIGDLGLPKTKKELKYSKEYNYTLHYESPEAIKEEECSFKVDIW